MAKYERVPKIWYLPDLIKHCNEGNITVNIGGRWIPARPLGFDSFSQRLKAAVLVFTGKADAVKWPGQ